METGEHPQENRYRDLAHQMASEPDDDALITLVRELLEATPLSDDQGQIEADDSHPMEQ